MTLSLLKQMILLMGCSRGMAAAEQWMIFVAVGLEALVAEG